MNRVEAIEFERKEILSRLPDRDLQFLPIDQRMGQLHNLARYSYSILRGYQEPNGLLPATVGRVDNADFEDGVWVKDHVRASRPALNPDVRKYLPDLEEGFTDLYLSATKGMLQVLSQSEQMRRFKEAKPRGSDGKGYAYLPDEDAPPIKFHTDGTPWEKWAKSNNQPDNWGIQLLEWGRGMRMGFPVLDLLEGETSAGQVIQRVTSFLVNAEVERLVCRSIWEHKPVHSSHSTMTIVLEGLGEIRKPEVWKSLVKDANNKDYEMEVSYDEVTQAYTNLGRKRKEKGTDDYTDLHHPGTADLAGLIVVNDTNLPKFEARQIIEKVMTLRNGVGFRRYDDDPYRKGLFEAIWTLGTTAMSRYYFNQALELYRGEKLREGNNFLLLGYDMLDIDIRLLKWFGYIPELLHDEGMIGVPVPNYNELVWKLGDLAQTAGTGLAAQAESEELRASLKSAA